LKYKYSQRFLTGGISVGEKIIAITDDGNILSINEIQKLARDGGVDSITSLDKEGNWTIQDSAATGETVYGSNLDQLPEF
jgi:hypothetical protein